MSTDAIRLLAEQLDGETDQRERMRIAARLVRLDTDHPALAVLGEQRIVLWSNLRPVSVSRVLPGLTSTDAWVRRCAAEGLIESRAETRAVITCLLDELRRATSPGSLYADRHHEIADAAMGAQFDYLRQQWPWFVDGLLTLGAAGPGKLFDDANITVRLNACRLQPDDSRVIPTLLPCLRRYWALDDSFWMFITAAELIAQMGHRAAAALPEIEALVQEAPERTVPKVLGDAMLARVRA